MRTIIAGTRGITDMALLQRAMSDCEWSPTVVLSGAEPTGVDALGEKWAKAHGIPVERYPADWSLGPKAGPIRNRLMASKADALVAVRHLRSRGTSSMILEAEKLGLRIYVLNLPV